MILLAGAIAVLVSVIAAMHAGGNRSAGFLGGSLVLSAHFVTIPSSGVGMLARFIGLAILIVAASGGGRERSKAKKVPGLRWVLASSCLVHIVVALMSPGGNPMVVPLGALMFLVTFVCLETSEHSSEIMRGVWVALVLSVAVSVLMFFVSFPDAVAGDRLRGLYVNANTLGIFAALTVLVCILRQGRWWTTGLISVVGLLAVLLSGSRSALLALSIGLVVYVCGRFWRGHPRGAVGVLAMMTGGFYILRHWGLFDASLVFRGNNSRESGTEYAIHQAPWTWFTGVGYQQSSIEVASTPLRWLAEGGLFCALVVVVAYLVVLGRSMAHGAPSTSLAIFGITSSLFEGWYVAATSGLFIIFWLCGLYVLQGGRDSLHRGGSYSAAHAGVQQVGH